MKLVFEKPIPDVVITIAEAKKEGVEKPKKKKIKLHETTFEEVLSVVEKTLSESAKPKSVTAPEASPTTQNGPVTPPKPTTQIKK